MDMNKLIINFLALAAISFSSCNPSSDQPQYLAPLKNPTRLTLTQTPFTEVVEVSWQDNCDNEAGYELYLKKGSEEAKLVETLGVDACSYTFTKGMKGGNSYSVGVRAVSDGSIVNSQIVYKEITLFDYSSLSCSNLNEGYAVTPSSVLLSYTFKQNASYPIENWGLCWSADHTPTIEDAHAHGPLMARVPVSQAIPACELEYNRDYKVRGFVKCSMGYVYGNEITVNLGKGPSPISLNWTDCTPSGMHPDIRVYKTTDKLNGRVFNAWYAIADVTRGNVEFRFKFNDGVQTMSKWYSAAKTEGENPQVLTNAGYFNMSTGKTGDFFTYMGTQSNASQSGQVRGVFGVDKDQKPQALWTGKSAGGFTYFYDSPIMNISGLTTYERCDENYPSESVSWEPYYAMCAGPLLVKNGKIMTDVTKDGSVFVRNYENIAADIFTDSSVTPDRTCVGYTSDGKIILFVCDGRIKASQGASIFEAAQIMKGLGCEGAVNFDGGGSTAMLVEGTRINSLESNMNGGTEDRAVGSVMGFFVK